MENQDIIIQQDLDSVEGILSSVLTDSIYEASINEMCLRVVKSGGKRVRPLLALTAWHALGDKGEKKSILNFAAATELLHTATLVHDDVIDKASVRRGKPTLNDTDGNHAAVLAGDYLFTRCFFCIHDINNQQIGNMLNNTLASLVSGEIKQLHTQGNLNISIEDYEQTIYCKTGALFELATAGAAILSDAGNDVISSMQEYGKQLGIAFQVADDILDYTSSSDLLGKNIGEDLEDGRVTLPLILALQNCSSGDKATLEAAIKNVDLKSVLQFINKTDSIQKSKDFALNAVNKAKKALCALPDTQYKKNLEDLAYRAATRTN